MAVPPCSPPFCSSPHITLGSLSSADGVRAEGLHGESGCTAPAAMGASSSVLLLWEPCSRGSLLGSERSVPS